MPAIPTWLTSTLWPSATASGWSLPAGVKHRLVAVPDVAAATQYLPWRLSSAFASARRASDDRPFNRQVKDALGVFGLLTVGSLKSSRRLGLTGDRSLVEHVSRLLGLGGASAIVLCGPPRPNQKPILQLHDRMGRTAAYIKVAWNDLTTDLLRREQAALTHLAAVDHPGFVVPQVMANGDWANGSWLAISPVRVHRRHRPDRAGIDRLALTIEQTSPGWEGLPVDGPFAQRLLDDVRGLPAGRVAVERLLERHAHTELKLAARHGDFVPWNMLSGAPSSAVWDWERYDELAPTGSDRFHHRVQLSIQRQGRTLPDAVARIDADLATIVPELDAPRAQAHLDWYLAEMLVRYEHDAQSNATPRVLDRIANLTRILEQRMLDRPLDQLRRPM